MVNVSQIKNGLAKYVDTEILPHTQGLNKAIIATGATLAISKIDNFLDKYRTNDTLKFLELVDSEGNVNIDLLISEFTKHIPEGGLVLNLPVVGDLIFYAADINTMHRYILNS